MIPFRDEERFLGDALRSVGSQTLAGWEAVLVDDGSTDGGAELARGFVRDHPGRSRLLRLPRSAGAFAARLRGAALARAGLVAFLDADDVWDPDYLAVHAARRRAARGELGLSYGPCRLGASGGAQTVPALRPRVFGAGELLRNFLSSGYGTTPYPSAVILPRALLLSLSHLAADAARLTVFEDQLLFWGAAARRPTLVHADARVVYRGSRAKSFPKARGAARLREEREFLRAAARDLASVDPGHPLLGPDGLPARLEGAAFFRRRIPPELAAR